LGSLFDIGVRYVCLRSVGYDHVDVEKAKHLGMKVANVPEYSPYSVAEHAAALLLAVNRKIVLGQKLMDIGDYRIDALKGFDLHGKTVGIIGTGKIGRAFAQIMNGFGCNLLAYDPVPDHTLQSLINITYVSLKELYKYSDVISIHCPLNVNTKHLICKEAFACMKKGITLINTARGAIIDTMALIDALDEGTVGFAGLDVYENEKRFFFEDVRYQKNGDDLFIQLRSYPNVLVTGHQAFLTHEALTGIAETTVSNLNEWAERGYCKNDLF
jgi:D-lactate dehydrogenase